MCDVYGHPCEKCGAFVDFHIGDFLYEREEFRVWCEQHLSLAPPGSVIFRWEAGEFNGDGGACAVLGPDVGGEGDNHPNIAGPWTETVVGEGVTRTNVPWAGWGRAGA